MIAVYNKPFIFRIRAKGEIYNVTISIALFATTMIIGRTEIEMGGLWRYQIGRI